MKRIVVYGLILAALWCVPVRGTELGKMIPVEAVYLYYNEDSLVIETDAGCVGSGKTAEEAIRNLHDGAPGIVFLDTADYLLIGENTEESIPLIKEHLKPNTRICKAERYIEIEEVSRYLSVHTPMYKLKDWKSGVKLQELCASEGQMYLR